MITPAHRLASFILPLAGAGWAWAGWQQPGRAAGLILLGSAAVTAWGMIVLPVVLLGGLAVPAALLAAGGWRPRAWRAARRHCGADTARHIPAVLQRVIRAADRHRCVYCASPLGLQFDHITPWAAGGLTALWNLALLCQTCNKIKSDYYAGRGGTWRRPRYHPWRGYDSPAKAAAILTAERAARWHPARWLRATWAL